MRRCALLVFLVAFVLAVPAVAGSSKMTPVHKITQSDSYLMIDPIYTTVMDGDKIVGLLMIGIGLDVPNAGLRDKTQTAMPVLRDVYVRSLMAFTATSVRPWRQPDVAADRRPAFSTPPTVRWDTRARAYFSPKWRCGLRNRHKARLMPGLVEYPLSCSDACRCAGGAGRRVLGEYIQQRQDRPKWRISRPRSGV